MRISIADAVRATHAYARIFDYQLSEEELRFWCVYRVLPKRYRARQVKPHRSVHPHHKWEIARHTAGWLSRVPTIELIGVTGALSMDNAQERDDIDLLIITKARTIWITRLLITLLLDLFSLRRRPGDIEYKDKICLNMFMTSHGLALSRKERDLFTAHEVLQMKPVWDRGGTYQKFLQANRWVAKFLPTAWRHKYQVSSIKYKNTQSILRFFEPLAKNLQLWYMRRRITTEIVSDTIIRFHPIDARDWIYRELQRKLGGTNIPLDKIFYGR